MDKLIVIEGTTASGKSDLAVALAERLGGEVVSADSRQVYRGLDLGTGKITPEEARGIPHHLIDVTDPGQFFSLADYQPMAYAAVDGIIKKGRVPILCGGTGLYVDAVAEGYRLSDKKPDLDYRAELETLDTPRLYEMLLEIEPEWDGDGKNRNRVMRRLEKIRAGDLEPGRKDPRYRVLRVACTYPRETLRERIDERLDRRFALGMTEEVDGLIRKGVDREFLLGLGLEYRFITRYLMGEYAFPEMREKLSTAIKQFSRRQMVWFRRHENAHWLSMEQDPLREAAAIAEAFLNGPD